MKKLMTTMILLLSINSFAKAPAKVGLIDTGVYPLNNKVSMNTININPIVENLHGTSLACILTQNDRVSVINIEHGNTFEGRIDGLKQAIKHQLDYILYTSAGEKVSKKEKYLIELAVKRGIVVVVAAGNKSKDLSKEKEYPCSYNIKGVHCIGNEEKYSNYGEGVIKIKEDFVSDCIQSLHGTSQSAAIYLRDLIKNK